MKKQEIPEDLRRIQDTEPARVQANAAALRQQADATEATAQRLLAGGADKAKCIALMLMAYNMRVMARLDESRLPAKLGKKMMAGRKKGTVGKVRAWVQKYMVKYPTAMPAQAWDAFKKRPPKGCTVYENRLGKYIETEGAPDTSRAWFGTIVGQERPKK